MVVRHDFTPAVCACFGCIIFQVWTVMRSNFIWQIFVLCMTAMSGPESDYWIHCSISRVVHDIVMSLQSSSLCCQLLDFSSIVFDSSGILAGLTLFVETRI